MEKRKAGFGNIAHWFFILLGTTGVLFAIVFRSWSEVFSDLLINLGSTFIAASLLSYLYQVVGEKSLSAQLEEFQESQEIVKETLKFGITKIWKERRDIHSSMWNEFTKNAQQEVWLYGVAEYRFAADEVFHEIVVHGLTRGCIYKILILDPGSNFASYWDNRDHAGNVPSKIRAAIQKYQRMIDDNKGKRGKIELRLYDESPSISIVRSDEEMLLTYYLPFHIGDHCPTLQLKATSDGLFTRYSKHFSRAWESSRILAST